MPSNEPVVWAALAHIIVLAAGHWGFKLDATALISAAIALQVALTPFIRATVKPMAKIAAESAIASKS